jgi:D-methionine transport system ATP-binding protein
MVTLLDHIDLSVPTGSLLHIIGPSGSGKSTLLRLLNRMEDASEGNIEILGKSVTDWSPRELRRQVAMLFQETTLLGRTPKQNFEMAFTYAGLPQPTDFAVRIQQVMHQAGCEMSWLDRQAAQLSVGQRQRLALARSLIVSPRILLLDEPTAALDPQTARALLDQMNHIREEQQTTILMVTHRIEEVQRLDGDLLMLNAGRMAYHGKVANFEWSMMEQSHA